MKHSNVTYEKILKEYLALKSAEESKTSNAHAKIEEANKQIEKNNALMAEATKRGDLDKYAELKADTAKQTEVVKFFTKVLEDTRRNSSIAHEDAVKLYAAADKETSTLNAEWHKKFAEAIRPLVELTNDYWLQLRMLEMAKNNIKNNLERGNDLGCCSAVGPMSLVLFNKFDNILQCEEYKAASPDVKGEEKFQYKRYEWQAPMMAKLSEESKRW